MSRYLFTPHDDFQACALARVVARALAMLAVVAAMSGCIVGPDYCGPRTPVPDVWHQELENGAYVGSNELHNWWMLFEDPTLTQLIDCAEKHNLNLYSAYTRICQARSQECIVEAAKKPMLSGTGGLRTSQQSLNAFNPAALGFGGGAGMGGMGMGLSGGIPAQSIWSLGLDVGWEPDLFGKVERQLQSAQANTCAQVEAYRDVLVSLYGDVAQSYVQVRTLQQQLLIACQNVELRKQSQSLANKRVEGGVSPNVDLFQADSELASAEADIPQLELQLNQALNRLSTLLGHYPGAMHCVLAEPGPIPDVPRNLPQVVPCDMIRQRPDIRQAERRIMGATADVGAAMAELLPSLRLGGNLSLSAINLGDLFEGDSFGFGLGPSFSWPILQGGRIRCNIAAKECAVEEAIVNYEQTLLRASEEVENSVVGFNKNRVRAAALERTVEAAEKSFESVLALYRAGQVDFQNVLDTQRTLFASQNALAIAQGQIITDLITFYRALGGGWDCYDHCKQPCVRLHCPQRCPPDSVKVQCDAEEVSRYFDLGSEDEDSDDDSFSDKTLTDKIRDRTADRDDEDSAGSSSEREGGRPSDSFFDKTIKELEERLKGAPPDTSPVDLESTPVTRAERPVTPADKKPAIRTIEPESLRSRGRLPSRSTEEGLFSSPGQLPTPPAEKTPNMRPYPKVPNPPKPSRTPVPTLNLDSAPIFDLPD